jgi:adenylate kinase family enzyme
MRRVAVVGSSGVGKTTLAEQVAEQLGVPVIELDALMHGPDWTPTPTPEFRAVVTNAIAEADTASDGWVIPGNYRNVADITQRRADTIVWLDLPRRVSIWRLFKRSVRRSVTREVVWGGNRESLADLMSRDPNRNVLLWAWRSHPLYQEVYASYISGDFWAHATVHRLRTRADVEAFTERLGARPEISG